MPTSNSLFTPQVAPDRQHSLLQKVATSAAHVPAREQLQRAYDLLPSPDPNFIKDFQSTGFNARICELYLAAVADSLRMQLTEPQDRPDYLLTHNGQKVWVEATTANPTAGTAPTTESGGFWEAQDAIAAKLGSPLFSKLNERYWELPHVHNMPLVIAIADFHDSDPRRPSFEALQRYLYATHLRLSSAPGETVTYDLEPLQQLGPKNIPAGFFTLPDAAHISAVLFSNAGTTGKFSRMGLNRFLHPTIRMLRCGFCFDTDPTAVVPEPFAYLVGTAPETWGQEVVIFHNPNALYPINQEFFAPLCQYWLKGNKFWHTMPEFFPYVSNTFLYTGSVDSMEALEQKLLAEGRRWVLTAKANTGRFTDDLIGFHKQWNPRRS